MLLSGMRRVPLMRLPRPLYRSSFRSYARPQAASVCFSRGLSTEDESKRNQNRRIASTVTGAGALAMLWGKGKWVLGAAKLTKFSSVISMMATTGTYAIFFGLPFAAGMVSLVAVHEAGHALVMTRYNIPFNPAVFVPFMGAVITMRGRPKDVNEEAAVAIGGPVLGGAAAIACSVVGISLDNALLISLADFGLMINLFNLMPIGQMDGGRIAGALSKWFLVGGLGVGGALIYQGMIYNPIFYLIMLSATYTTYQRFFGIDGIHPSYYRMNNGQRVLWTGSYFGLIAVLLAAQAVNNKYKKSIRQLRSEANLPQASGPTIFDEVAEWNRSDPYVNPDATQIEQDFMRDYFGPGPEKRTW